MHIALCCDTDIQATEQILREWGEVDIFRKEENSRAAGQQLTDFLSSGGHCDLAVVSMDGSEGLRNCMFIKRHKENLPVLWISDDKRLYMESRRIGVEEFLIRPVPGGMLRKIINYMLEGVIFNADIPV